MIFYHYEVATMRQKGSVKMCDTMKLKGKMREHGVTQETLAAAVKIDRSTLNRRLKNGEDFTIGEANRIVNTLQLTADEAMQIFLPTLSH